MQHYILFYLKNVFFVLCMIKNVFNIFKFFVKILILNSRLFIINKKINCQQKIKIF